MVCAGSDLGCPPHWPCVLTTVLLSRITGGSGSQYPGLPRGGPADSEGLADLWHGSFQPIDVDGVLVGFHHIEQVAYERLKRATRPVRVSRDALREVGTVAFVPIRPVGHDSEGGEDEPTRPR